MEGSAAEGQDHHPGAGDRCLQSEPLMSTKPLATAPGKLESLTRGIQDVKHSRLFFSVDRHKGGLPVALQDVYVPPTRHTHLMPLFSVVFVNPSVCHTDFR